MKTFLYSCVAVLLFVAEDFIHAAPEAEASLTGYEIPNYYRYRYGQDLNSPSKYGELHRSHPIAFGIGDYKGNDHRLHTYESNSYEHKGYPPKGYVSVSYGQKGYGQNSYVHKTIGYDHKGHDHRGYLAHPFTSYDPYNNYAGSGYGPAGYVQKEYSHKGYEHKGTVTELSRRPLGYGQVFKGYDLGLTGYNGFTLGDNYNVHGYEHTLKPYGLGHVAHGFAHQSHGIGDDKLYGVKLSTVHKLDEFPYGDHLRYGYGRDIISPYAISYLRR